ncbi:type II toxin-antitoxin system YafQ family toxin [Photorhabdus antumapuensis]
MRTIDYANQFKRDYKREKKGRHREVLDDVLMLVVELLAC